MYFLNVFLLIFFNNYQISVSQRFIGKKSKSHDMLKFHKDKHKITPEKSNKFSARLEKKIYFDVVESIQKVITNTMNLISQRRILRHQINNLEEEYKSVT